MSTFSSIPKRCKYKDAVNGTAPNYSPSMAQLVLALPSCKRMPDVRNTKKYPITEEIFLEDIQNYAAQNKIKQILSCTQNN